MEETSRLDYSPVVNWHRAGFRLYWTWISRFRRVGGRKGVSKEVRALIFRMVAENPTWGAPRAHGELLNLRPNGSRLVSIPVVGGLHHRYIRVAA